MMCLFTALAEASYLQPSFFLETREYENLLFDKKKWSLLHRSALASYSFLEGDEILDGAGMTNGKYPVPRAFWHSAQTVGVATIRSGSFPIRRVARELHKK